MAEIREDIRLIPLSITIVSEGINSLTTDKSKENYNASLDALKVIDSIIGKVSQTTFNNNDERDLVLGSLKFNLKPALVKLGNYYAALRGDTLTEGPNIQTDVVDQQIERIEQGRQRVLTPIKNIA